MKDATSLLRTATRRFKSDVANKLVGMFLHEISRRISRDWPLRVDGEEYECLVRERFCNRCPYCSRDLASAAAVIEHLDGMNRYRAGLHVAGNVLVACKRCNSEKRRDDQLKELSIASSGWESFLSHDGTHCSISCATCVYWATIWIDENERKQRLADNVTKIRLFRAEFAEFGRIQPLLATRLPALLTKLYSDCQNFAETEINTLLARFEQTQFHAGAGVGKG